ncbi:type II toxin-antitoxin system VapC family toxin [Acidocella sp.]|uniref:type II toxin-antitoxin system VapC family toxin n=1 Tax=Acidocella sp. TaxID=50710 RepID=UPI00261C3EC6|nr:type II toxin-antitoxin system VapC family toxin [Acidocella sp.]
MKLLLDTHVLLWWLADDTRLGRRARELIADPAHDVLVSAVSLWEIAVKVRVGKLEASLADISAALQNNGFLRLGLEDTHLRALMALPLHHRDPFDHLLMAQAVAEGAVFCSDDVNMEKYGVRMIAAA